MESFSALMDVFYESREREERTRQRGQDLIRIRHLRPGPLPPEAGPAARRTSPSRRDRDQLRISGELITANLYRMERGQTKLTAENYL